MTISTGPRRAPAAPFDRFHIDDMVGGWFVGAFTPAALHLDVAEVAFKRLIAGQTEARHVHLRATEVVLIISGSIDVSGTAMTSGDIWVVPPGQPSQATALTDCALVVVKTPSAPEDKYPA